MKRKIIEYLKTLPENVVNNDIVSLGNLDLLDLDIFYGYIMALERQLQRLRSLDLSKYTHNAKYFQKREEKISYILDNLLNNNVVLKEYERRLQLITMTQAKRLV